MKLDRNTDLCPCRSGMLIRDCNCLKPNGRLIPDRSKIKLPTLADGHAHRRCYAVARNDCGSKISREHYISHSLLREMLTGNYLQVSGVPWLEAGVTQELSPKSLTAKILCERHNSALSSLDAIALKVFRAIRSVPKRFKTTSPSSSDGVMLVNGHDFERWLIKTLCGIACVLPNPNKTHWLPSQQWLDLLLGEKDFEPGLGMYMRANVGESIDASDQISAQTIYREQDNELVGMSIGLQGLWFGLALDDWVRKERAVYRPNELVFKHSGRTEIIAFGWDDYVDNRSVVLSWNPPDDESSAK